MVDMNTKKNTNRFESEMLFSVVQIIFFTLRGLTSFNETISFCSEVLDGVVALFFFPEAEVLFQKLDN